ncbi:hypothetical protein [Streptomyces atratus]|uniref:hypothetical protein n=1 Tax=Streptomyces atratus TaxID=1893 RepID=UPI0033DDAA91
MTAHNDRGTRTRPAGAAAATAALLALASRCAGGSSADTGAGSAGGAVRRGVRGHRADRALRPDPAPQGAASHLNTENFLARIEEWSGGKITLEIAYTNAAAGATEIDDALADGRLDVGSVLIYYEPSGYPATNALIDAGILNEGSPVVGVLQSNTWANEVAFSTLEIMAERDAHCLVPLVPVWSGGANGLLCTEESGSLEQTLGVAVAATSTIQNQPVEALGATPASIVYTISSRACSAGGRLHHRGRPRGPPRWRRAGGPSRRVRLRCDVRRRRRRPRVQQRPVGDPAPRRPAADPGQHERLLEENITAIAWPTWPRSRQRQDGAFTRLDEPARAALAATNEEVLHGLRASTVRDGEELVEESTAAAERWTDKVEDLGFDQDVDYSTFTEWWDDSDDLSTYTDTVMTNGFGPHRSK